MLSTVAGASSLVFIRVWANLLSKNRALARPWNHLICAGVGGYIGYNYGRWENELFELVNEKRVNRGMPPITRDKLPYSSK